VTHAHTDRSHYSVFSNRPHLAIAVMRSKNVNGGYMCLVLLVAGPPGAFWGLPKRSIPKPDP